MYSAQSIKSEEFVESTSLKWHLLVMCILLMELTKTLNFFYNNMF